MHNDTPGGEINTKQTGQKILTRCICLGVPFAVALSLVSAAPLTGPLQTAPLVGYIVTDFPSSLLLNWACIVRVLCMYSALSLLFTFLRSAQCPLACVSLACGAE